MDVSINTYIAGGYPMSDFPSMRLNTHSAIGWTRDVLRGLSIRLALDWRFELNLNEFISRQT